MSRVMRISYANLPGTQAGAGRIRIGQALSTLARDAIGIAPDAAGLVFNYFLHGKTDWLDRLMPKISMGGIVTNSAVRVGGFDLDGASGRHAGPSERESVRRAALDVLYDLLGFILPVHEFSG